MEGSKSEAIFKSLNLNPRLFFNEILNVADDLLEKSFSYFLGEASSLLKTEGTDRDDELIKGVAYIHNMIQLTLDERMQKWEEYCLRFCFHVPEALSLPESEESAGDDLPNLDTLADTDLDAELNTLRDKLTLVVKESAELGRKLYALERQSLSNNQFSAAVDEVLQLYKKHDTTQMFQELSNSTLDLSARLQLLKKRKMEGIQCSKSARLCVTQNDVLGKNLCNGLANPTLEKVQEFLDEIAP